MMLFFGSSYPVFCVIITSFSLAFICCAEWNSIEKKHHNFIELQQYSSIEIPVKPDGTYFFCPKSPEIKHLLPHLFQELKVFLKFVNNEGDSLGPPVLFKLLFGNSKSDLHKQMTLTDSDSSGFLEGFSFSNTPFSQQNSPQALPLVYSSPSVEFEFPAFPTRCFGVYDIELHESFVSMNVTTTYKASERRLLIAFVGFILLLIADNLANSIISYYISGVSLIVISSFLIILIFIIRLMPMRRSGTLLQGAILLVGGTFSLFFVFVDYIRAAVVNVILSNTEIFISYTVIVTLCSFIILYWFQIPDSFVSKYPRTRTLLRISLRFIGGFLIISSFYLPFDEIAYLESMYEDIMKIVYPDISEPPKPRLYFILPAFVRLSLIIFLVFLTSLLQCGYTYVLRQIGFIKRDSEFSTFSTIRNEKRCMVGSPWASSSPNQCVHCHNNGILHTPVYQSRFEDYPKQDMMSPNIHFRVPDRDVYPPSHAYSNRRNFANKSQIKVPDFEILTDDDSD